MVHDVVGGALKIIGRFIAHVFIEILFELLVKGPGYLISKRFTKQTPDSDGFVVVFTGFLFWMIVGGAVYALYINFGANGNA